MITGPSTYFMMATTLMATIKNVEAVAVQAAVDLRGEHSDFLQALFKQMDLLVTLESEDSSAITQVDAARSKVTPSVTITGNITDPERRLTLTFTLQASRTTHYHSSASLEDDDDDDEEDDEWRSSSGVLTPIVDVVEPYFLSFVELVFNGILSTVISNFLDGTSLLGDVRLV